MKQTVSVVLNPLIKNSNRQSWSLIKLFGLSIRKPCWLASESRILVDITDNSTMNSNQLSPIYTETVTIDNQWNGQRKYAIYDINDYFRLNPNATKFNVASIYQQDHNHQLISGKQTMVYANRFFIDNGFFNGKIKCKIFNDLDQSIEIIYFDTLPWFLRFYLHTLELENSRLDEIDYELMHYQPAKYKERPYHLELKLNLPANSVTTISFDVDKVFLKWTEYPPDANHGIYVSSSIIKILNSSDQIKVNDFRLTTEPLLIGLPTPDFSMPYNVICLVSTVISLCFAPIHNFTTRIVQILNNKKS